MERERDDEMRGIGIYIPHHLLNLLVGVGARAPMAMFSIVLVDIMGIMIHLT
jgi:hypothetical protein